MGFPLAKPEAILNCGQWFVSKSEQTVIRVADFGLGNQGTAEGSQDFRYSPPPLSTGQIRPVENIAIDSKPVDPKPKRSGGCGCGCAAEPEVPELDVTKVPKLIRHAAVLGGVGGLKPGQAFVIAVPHDPLPLLKQIERQFADSVTADYLTRGPEVWRVQLSRV
jgi:uncharacterized protein (DUF2249 family)